MNTTLRNITLLAAAVALTLTTSTFGEKEKDAKDVILPQTPKTESVKLTRGKPTMHLVGDTIITPSGLKYIDLRLGTGGMAKEGQMVSIHFIGTFLDGKKFYSTRDLNAPFDFLLGKGKVIKGMDEGVASMRIGGLRKLIVPHQLGYGEKGEGSIPPKTTLVYEVELLGVK